MEKFQNMRATQLLFRVQDLGFSAVNGGMDPSSPYLIDSDIVVSSLFSIPPLPTNNQQV